MRGPWELPQHSHSPLPADNQAQPGCFFPKHTHKGKTTQKERQIPGRQAAEVPQGSGTGAAFSFCFSTQRLCSATPRPSPHAARGCWFIYTPARQQGHFSKLSEFLSHLLTQRWFRIASFLPKPAAFWRSPCACQTSGSASRLFSPAAPDLDSAPSK